MALISEFTEPSICNAKMRAHMLADEFRMVELMQANRESAFGPADGDGFDLEWWKDTDFENVELIASS
ncbi:hypothetical protein RM52_01865 [Microbacterium hominis]|uniref:Uncharacterized protein n=1 Tax=Microbacterium hominis TaxID=162426 RepID=A0A0B4E0U1_9MICO|nr:hypothetical protein RM52_01865 [Microbacterium hominis]